MPSAESNTAFIGVAIDLWTWTKFTLTQNFTFIETFPFPRIKIKPIFFSGKFVDNKPTTYKQATFKKFLEFREPF